MEKFGMDIGVYTQAFNERLDEVVELQVAKAQMIELFEIALTGQ